MPPLFPYLPAPASPAIAEVLANAIIMGTEISHLFILNPVVIRYAVDAAEHFGRKTPAHISENYNINQTHQAQS